VAVATPSGADHYDLVHAQFRSERPAGVSPSACPWSSRSGGCDLLGEIGDGERYTLVGKLLQRVSRVVAAAPMR